MTIAPPRQPSPTRWWTLTTVSFGTLMLMFDVSITAIALPEIRQSLNASFSELQWVLDAYALTLAVFLVTAGSFADRYGRKVVFLCGFTVFTVASLACGVAGSPEALNVSRAVQGIGAAVLFAVGPAMLGHEFHGKERAAAFSVFGASTGLGLALGPLLGGGLTSGLSWEWIFFINVPIGIVAIAVTALKSPESRDPKRTTTDWIGMVILTVALTCAVFAIIRGGTDGWASAQNITLYTIAALALIIFVPVEIRLGERAMFEMTMFRNVTFVGISLVALFANAAGLPSVFIETSYVSNVLNSSAWSTGLRFLPLTLALFFFGVAGGALIGKIGFRMLMGVACSMLAVGLLLTRLADADSAWTALIPSFLCVGFGIGVFNPVRASLAIGVTSPAKAGVASGINETFQQVGIALGIAVIGAIFQNRIAASLHGADATAGLGDADTHRLSQAISAGYLPQPNSSPEPLIRASREAFVTGFHDSMTICAALAVVAAVAAFALIRRRDLHASAFSPIPPDLEGDSDASEASAAGMRTAAQAATATNGDPVTRLADHKPV